MKLRSFRLRIALLSTALAGSALVGFGAVSWFQIYNAQISRLDAQLLNQLIRATRSPKRERWQFYGDSLPYAFGTNTKIPIALLVLDANGNTLYQYNEVSADKDVNRLLVQRLELTPVPPPPKREPPPKPESTNPSALPPPFIRPPQPRFVTQQTATESWRIGAAKFPNVQVAIAVSLQAVNQQMATIHNIFLVSIPGALLLVASGAWLVSGSALRPIGQLTGVIQQVTVKGLDQRIPIGTTDVEFVELIQVFNQMLERLERSFTQASRFSADAAHELKTPLTILQGELERTLQQVKNGSEMQQRLSNLLDEVRRLSGIMRKLLLLSLADAGQMSLYLVEVDMSELLIEMVEDVELLAPHLSVQIDITDRLRVQGDRDLLIQVLQNLLSNAIKYNLANGWIQIHAHRIQTTLHVTIANASIDIPVSHQERIFDRFHRGDRARTRKVEGIGLGLSLAREIARAHRGDLTLDSTSNGQTAFTLTLPITKKGEGGN
ncbi:integral membrane sensor signal transduction histidine kinase [Scytonema sp. HK-05]|uniref:sensor histidine kinase n=1 Tax=Scytonema sp. HK-05 TaxID=1137095 RepID=UPI0009378728|nr:ATP-binding protein [Scytonema sp. HK-05]OKH60811.1 two-component sensor histidine kinase [Scytonema sp. HK-05]BAY45114.1 integral membrane sensor signal transduction histidine kinase [Scytonema sp. HK-05]